MNIMSVFVIARITIPMNVFCQSTPSCHYVFVYWLIKLWPLFG